jgi:hypothetical protein
VRVEPEQVLIQNRVAAQVRVKNPDAEGALHGDQQQRNRHHGRAQHLNQARGVHRPHEQRQAEPSHAWRAHLVNRHEEVNPREDGGEACQEHPNNRQAHFAFRERAAVGRVEGPSRVNAAAEERNQHQQRARHEEVPAQQVQARERHIARANHQRQQEVAEHRRDRRDEEQENHDHPVRGEHLVVDVRGEQVSLRRRQLQADERGCQPAQQEERC